MTNGNDAAFGAVVRYADGIDAQMPGLTKREYFAAMAMQGMLSSDNMWLSSECKPGEDPAVSAEMNLALAAVEHADALIAALNEKQ